MYFVFCEIVFEKKNTMYMYFQNFNFVFGFLKVHNFITCIHDFLKTEIKFMLLFNFNEMVHNLSLLSVPTCTYPDTHTYMHLCIQTYINTNAYTHKQSPTHMHTHRHINTNIHINYLHT